MFLKLIDFDGCHLFTFLNLYGIYFMKKIYLFSSQATFTLFPFSDNIWAVNCFLLYAIRGAKYIFIHGKKSICKFQEMECWAIGYTYL